MDFADALREAMERASDADEKMTQEKLAELSGVSQQAISDYLNGVSRPRFDTLQKLEAALPQLHRLRTKAVA